MDWINGLVHKLKKQWKKTSLKKILVVYVFFAIVGVLLVWRYTAIICDGWVQSISYSVFGDEQAIVTEHEGYVVVQVEHHIIILLVVKYGSILVYSIIAIFLTAHYFYKNRLEQPISLLKEEVASIDQNDLGFDCSYGSKDEIGELCEMFNQMRLQMVQSQKEVWKTLEQQNELNAALVHDLRTPLTVMQGYTDLIVKYYPKGKMTDEKLLETLGVLKVQILRMKDFIEAMKDIRDLSQRVILTKEMATKELYEKIESVTEGLRLSHSIAIVVENHMEDCYLHIDEQVVLQVFDNLMSNALSFCKCQITVILETNSQSLMLYVRDDGCGFGEKELFVAERPYYCGRKETDASQHYGIGLSICKLLCEKHQGSLTLSNSLQGGAIACASFSKK